MSMEQYPQVFVNQQLHDWVKSLPMATFATNNRTSERTQCTPCFAIQGVDPGMTFSEELTMEGDHRRLDADHVQATMQQIHEHLQVEVRRSQEIQEEGANRGPIPTPNIQVWSQGWLVARYVWTRRPTWQSDWKWFERFTVVRWLPPKANELEQPGAIQVQPVQPVLPSDPVDNDPLLGQCVEPPPPVEDDGKEEYQVSSVEDR